MSASISSPSFKLVAGIVVPGAKPEEKVTELGKGVAIKLMDSSAIADYRMVEFMKNTAENHNITWQPDESTEVKILKQSAGFTLDGATSSKRLLTLQRNNLTENVWFTEEYFTGVTLKSDFNNQWFYQAGVFASDDAEEIGVTDASYFLFASLDYALDVGPKLDEAIPRTCPTWFRSPPAGGRGPGTCTPTWRWQMATSTRAISGALS